MFSRQGFTQGYYLGQKGQEMFGTRQEGEDAKELFAAAGQHTKTARHSWCLCIFTRCCKRGGPRSWPCRTTSAMCARRSAGAGAGGSITALTREDLESRLAKTGGTPYRCASVKTALGGDVQLPASAINADAARGGSRS